MCDRHGNFHQKFSRRSVLKMGAIGAATVSLPASMAGMLAPGTAMAASNAVKATHGTGFCNMSFFLTKERHLAENPDVEIDFVVTPSNQDIATLFGAGVVDMSLIPYSNFMTLYDAGAPVKIVAGGGIEGCVIAAQKGIKTAEDLRGKTFGTFQADTLEVLPFDWLKKHGMSFDDIDIRYMNTSPELAQAFMSGAVDAMCHIEPYATLAVQATEGATVLSDGTDVYGKGYADCVLAVRTPLLEKSPEVVRAVIYGMMKGEHQFETDIDAALNDTVGKYYKTTMEAARMASTKQPSVVDQRYNQQFIIDRGASMMELGYIQKMPDEGTFDWSFLEQVIAANQDLYSKLKYKSA